MSFGFQGWEWVIILAIVLLIFGPKKVPELARGLGQAIYEFRKASQGLVEGEEKKKTKTGKSEAEGSEKAEKMAEKMGAGDEEKKGKAKEAEAKA